MTAHDVAVIGAGPVGLTLALGLARAGRSVLVLEKEPGTSEHSRAPAIWPRTQEILAEIGVIDRFMEEGIILPRIEVWDADHDRTLVRLPLEELRDETAFPHLLICSQATTERLLCEALERESSARLLFSAEVLDITQKESGLEVRYELSGAIHTAEARFAAGCDGAHSNVREIVGASFDGLTYDIPAALADITLDEDRDLHFPRVTYRRNPSVAIRIDARLWRLILPFTASDENSLDERIENAVEDLFSTRAYTTVWKSGFHLHRRISSLFASGRIALAGDAAHLNSPVGGQGMNAGIQDAEALLQALLDALESNDPAPLADYARRRRKAIEQGVNRFTHRLTRLLPFVRMGLFGIGFRLAGIALRFRPLRRRVLRRIMMLDA